jgi:hypothetical protein
MGRRGIQGSYSDIIALLPTAPKTTGGNLQLADGQIGLFKDESGNDGLPAVNNITTTLNAKYYLEVGTSIKSNSGGYTSKGLRSVAFKAEDVLDVKFSESKPAQVAKVYLGWDGLNSNKSISLQKGQVSTITVRLSGEPIGHLGYSDGVFEQTYTVSAPFEEACEDNCTPASCETFLLPVVNDIKNTLLRSGVKLEDIIDVIPVSNCLPDQSPTGSVTFYTITLCDNGDDAALGLVEGQVNAPVVRVSYVGNVSTYQVYTSNGAPEDFVSPAKSVKTDCEGDCPDGFVAVGGGYAYTFAIEDDGTNLASTLLDTIVEVADTATAIAGVTVGAPAALRAAGTYTINSGYTTSGSGTGATFTVVVNGSGAATVTINNHGTGFAVANTITIPDALLGAGGAVALVLTVATLITNVATVTKLGQVFGQGKYLVVSSSPLSTASLTDLTTENPTLAYEISGFSESICVEEEPATTEWVEGDSCDTFLKSFFIDLQDTECGNSRLAELQAAYPELMISEDEETTPTTCRRRYVTSVVSEFLCRDCHTDLYKVTAPANFGVIAWEEVPAAASEEANCKCGILFQGKEFKQCPPKELAHEIATRVGQVKIEVSGGETPLYLPVGYRNYTGEPFAVTHAQRPFDGTGWGFEYITAEKEAYKRLVGVPSGNSYAEQWFKGTTSKLEPCEQYDTISVKVKANKHISSFANVTSAEHRYIYIVPKGTKPVFQSFFNMVAAGNPNAGSI